MTATYKNGSVSFLYPENWLLSESETDPDTSSNQVTLETPTGGMWLLFVSSAATDSQNAIREVQAAIDEQFEDIEWNEANEPFHGYDSSGLDGFFYSLDLLVCSRIRVFKTLDRLFLILVQSESRELDKNSDVFDAITLSLLQSTSAFRFVADQNQTR